MSDPDSPGAGAPTPRGLDPLACSPHRGGGPIEETRLGFPGLVSLDLTRNSLAALPPSLGNLPKLEDLGLRQNALTRLPPLANPALKELYLGANKIKVCVHDTFPWCGRPNHPRFGWKSATGPRANHASGHN